MAHFAQINESGVVTQVIVIGDNDAQTESAGQAFIANRLRLPGTWLQTSYNTRGGAHAYGGEAFRLNYAGIGFTYSEELDGFIPPQPYPSWLLNTTTGLWDAPIPYPEDGEIYIWDEPTLTWKEYEQSLPPFEG
jgi:hypothetical protein